MPNVSVQTVNQVLENVLDPVFDKPMLEVGSLRNVRLSGDQVELEVVLSSPSDEQKARANSWRTAESAGRTSSLWLRVNRL